MITTPSTLLFSHNHHLLSVKGSEAVLDVLAFDGDEALSSGRPSPDFLNSIPAMRLCMSA